MLFFHRDLFTRRLIKPVLCALVGMAMFTGGCSYRQAPLSDAVERVPDKEKFLLSQLQVRFENPEVHCELGRFYMSEGLLDKAQYHLDTALGFNPAHRKSQAAYVKLMELKNNPELARLYAERYQRQLERNPSELVALAKCFGEEGLDEYALQGFHKALELDARSAEANKQLGYYYLTRNDKAKAIEYFTRSFELNPNQSDVAGELGRMGVVVETPRSGESVAAETSSAVPR